ncbi:MAG: DNA-binding protein [Ginsengibacter sp.]
MIKATLGNIDFLKLPKTAFLCSRKIPASVVLKCYDWAIAQRESGSCVISGFHSQLEKDVLHYLLKGNQPIIIAMARGLKQKIEPELQKPFDEGRLLFITPFEKEVKRITPKTATIRNKMMLEIADEIVVGFASDNVRLKALMNHLNKPVRFLT